MVDIFLRVVLFILVYVRVIGFEVFRIEFIEEFDIYNFCFIEIIEFCLCDEIKKDEYFFKLMVIIV